MNSKSITKVLCVNGSLQAAVVQDAFENAGIPVTILLSDDGFDVMVPTPLAFQVHEMIQPKLCSGEIYFIPSYPIRLVWPRA